LILRIPRKKELIELQKKYRTDKKIGEVYGVPARLVAYWRNKKKIGSFSQPKYTEEKILEYWERFGDDSRAGAELGISSAGFRQWRRKYDITKKPLQLRLEQLEFNLNDNNRRKSSRRETVIQKILAKKSGLKKVESGQFISLEPDIAISDNNTGQVIDQFKEIGAGKIWHPDKIAIVLSQQMQSDSNCQNGSFRSIRNFIKENKIRNFYDIGEGICHQVIMENGHLLPGDLGLTTDHLATSYGCLGSISAEINPMEMGALWATGRTWMRVPQSIKLMIHGRLNHGVYANDIVLKIIRDLSGHNAEYMSLEFVGPVVSSMSASERITLTSFAHVTGAKFAFIPFDDLTMRFIRKVTKSKYTPVRSDPDAVYHNEIEIDVSYLTPQVTISADNGQTVPLEELEGRKIDLVVLGSSANGRLEDLGIAANVLRGRRISRDLRMVVIPGSRKILLDAIDEGYIRTFVESGCIILSPGYGSCLSSLGEISRPGERTFSTSFGHSVYEKSGKDEIYAGSPATAAATALEGRITDPRRFLR
jgi:3-isopropylmalate/(R)-2-methylmalate dehydratase large subunit